MTDADGNHAFHNGFEARGPFHPGYESLADPTAGDETERLAGALGIGGVEAELIDVNDNQSPEVFDVDAVEHATEETSEGRMRRAGQFMLNLPEKTSDAVTRGYIAFKKNPYRATDTAVTATAAIAALGFQQSPANESLRFEVGTELLMRGKGEIIVGLGVAAMATLIDGIPSYLIARGLRREGGIVHRASSRLVKHKEEKDAAREEKKLSRTDNELESEPVDAIVQPAPEVIDEPEKPKRLARISQRIKGAKILDKLTDVGLTLGVGAGFMVAKRHIQAENPTYKEDLKNGAKATGLIATANGLGGYLVAGGIRHLDKIGLRGAGDFFVNNILDWKFWTGAVVAGYTLGGIKKGAAAVKDKFVHAPAHLKR